MKTKTKKQKPKKLIKKLLTNILKGIIRFLSETPLFNKNEI